MKYTCISLISLAITVLWHNCCAQDALSKKIDAYAHSIKGNVGVYALILETGDSVSYHGDNHFPMQSVYKFPIAMVVLKKADEGALHLNQKIRINKSEYVPANTHSPIRDMYPMGADLTIRELLRYNVSESDGSACDVLIRLLGGIQKTNNL